MIRWVWVSGVGVGGSWAKEVGFGGGGFWVGLYVVVV